MRFVGFIQRAQSGGDESVNCGRTRIENHDIHLDLAATKTAGHAPDTFGLSIAARAYSRLLAARLLLDARSARLLLE